MASSLCTDALFPGPPSCLALRFRDISVAFFDSHPLLLLGSRPPLPQSSKAIGFAEGSDSRVLRAVRDSSLLSSKDRISAAEFCSRRAFHRNSSRFRQRFRLHFGGKIGIFYLGLAGRVSNRRFLPWLCDSW